MNRLKKIVSFEPTEPLVIKEEEDKEECSNGTIPVKIDDFVVYYDTKAKDYFAVIKVEGKRIVLKSG